MSFLSPRRPRLLVDLAWSLLALAFLAWAAGELRAGRLCAYMAADFRGYYAAARIALEQGIPAVYDLTAQHAAQAALAPRCPPGGPPPPVPPVAVPYLPVFLLPFLPLPALDFTSSYLLTTVLNLALAGYYLLRFSRRLGVRLGALAFTQWLVGLPLLSTLFLGQVNLWLVVCLGEFSLALLGGKPRWAGLWLAGLLVKPHMLLLLLPGLALADQWRALAGFAGGALGLLGLSTLLGGRQGVLGASELALGFAGPLIRTAPAMMSWRALALNLSAWLPGWGPGLAWGLGLVGIALTAGAALWPWRRADFRIAIPQPGMEARGERLLLLILASWAGTCAIAWHAHFYLLLAPVPLLATLDGRGRLPEPLRAAWLLAPGLVFALAAWLAPGWERNAVGLAYLGIALGIVGWAWGEARGT